MFIILTSSYFASAQPRELITLQRLCFLFFLYFVFFTFLASKMKGCYICKMISQHPGSAPVFFLAVVPLSVTSNNDNPHGILPHLL